MSKDEKNFTSTNDSINKDDKLNSDKSSVGSDDPYYKSDKYVFTNIPADIVSYLLISIVCFGSYYIYLQMDTILYEIKIGIPDGYKFPTYYDLLPSLYFLLILIIGHEIFRKLTADRLAKHLTPRYFKEGDEVLIDIYKNKVSSNIYKFMFYLFSSVFGFYVLKDLEYFPWTLGGSGVFNKVFVPWPDMFYKSKPLYFDLYYNLNLSFALFDGYLLISNPLQSDFLFMVLHHLATYSLIIFSFVANLPHVGAIIYYLHYLGDVFSYVVRVAVHLNVSERVPMISTFTFLVVFSYTRLFVFGDVIYYTYYGLDYKWSIIESNLFGFLFILMVLNILWIVLIARKFIKYCMTGNIEEIYKFKIKNKKVN
jgi:hypothetical protein